MDPFAPRASSRILAAAAVAIVATTSATAQQAAPAEPSLAGLPSFLLPVPAGQVSVGLTVEQMVQIARESVMPSRPEYADRETKSFTRALSKTASELGQEKHTLPTFLLGKHPITNREYEAYIKHMAGLGVKIKPPYHWWRYGREDDYNNRIKEINTLFPKDGTMAAIYYWEQKGSELPYALKTNRGEDISDHPVVYVSFVDAVRYAGWLGMRLPTEVEWTRAARGDSQNIWPWGSNKEIGDKYSESVLGKLQLARAGDRHTLPTGTVPFLAGPFGHVDMVGQVWEFTADRGYTPISGHRLYDLEWKRVQKDKVTKDLLNHPSWRDTGVIAKGASYLSWSDPIQFHIDSRVGVGTTEVVEGVGFRLAKSLRPGYDLLLSLVSSDYNQDALTIGQQVDFDAQVGIERYELDATGFPTAFHAVSFAPLDFVSTDKNASGQKVEDKSQQEPMPIGTLATTEPLLVPKAPAGLYTILYRKGGVPKPLKEAWSAGFKEVQRALRRKAHGGEEGGEEKAADEPVDGKDKSDGKGWREVLTRYGLTEKDLESKDTPKEPKFVRFGTLEVPIDIDAFLYHDNAGKIVAYAPSSGMVAGNTGPAVVALGQEKVEKVDHMMVEFRARTPLLKDQKKGVEYKLQLVLEQAPPGPNETWRLPNVP